MTKLNRNSNLIYLVFLLLLCPLSAKESFLVTAKSEKAAELLRQGKVFIQQKQWLRAIECYQNVLEKYRDRIVLVSKDHYVSALSLALNALGDMPDEARKLYQEVYVIKFRQYQNQSGETFSAIEQLFPFLALKQGKAELMRQISQRIAREQYQQALPYLSYYLRNYHDRDHSFQDKIWALLAFCYYALGDKPALDDIIAKYTNQNQQAKIVIAGKSQKMIGYLRQLVEALTRGKASWDIDWPMYGRNVRREFLTQQNIPDLDKSWGIKIPAPPRKRYRGFFYNEGRQDLRGPEPYYPVVADGTIFINTGKEILAYDLLSGKHKWQFAGLVPELKSAEHSQVIHRVSYHHGAIYANIEGDTPTQSRDTWSYYQIRKIIPERRLIKLDAANGRMLWQVRSIEKDEEAFANKASFMSPPLFWGGKLYVGVAELTGLFNSYMTAIDPETGKILWRTLIGSTQQELNMFGRPVREAVGSAVSTGNGQLYYLTNLGACCSLDAVTGNILWLYFYDRVGLPKNNQALFRTVYRKNCWYNSPIIAHGESIYFAPIDSEYLYCLDARTGKMRWRKYRDNHRYLLSVTANIVVIGGDSLQLVASDNGRRLANLELPGERLTGMGVVGNGVFYCPTNRNLLAVDLATKRIVQRFPWPPVANDNAGHIVIADSVMVSANEKYLSVFYNWKKLHKRLEQQLAKNPNHPLGYIKLAKLYAQRSENSGVLLNRAEKMYQKGLIIAEKLQSAYKQFYIDRAQKGLLDIYLRLAGNKEKLDLQKEAMDYYRKALPLAAQADIAILILLKQHNYYQQAEQYPQARDCLQTLINKYGQESYYLQEKGQNISVALYGLLLLGQLYEQMQKNEAAVDIYQKMLSNYPEKIYEGVSVRRWAIRHIDRLLKIFGREIYHSYDLQAHKLYKAAKGNGSNSSLLTDILQRYPNSRCVSQVYIDIAQAMLTQGRIRNAIENLRRFIREYPQTPETAIAYYLLVKCYEKIKMYTAAKTVLRRLQSQHFGRTFLLDGEKIVIADFVRATLDRPLYKGIQEKLLPKLQLWAKDTVKYQFENTEGTTLRLLKQHGQPSEKYAGRVFFNTARKVFCRDGATGKLLWKMDIGWLNAIGFAGDHLIAWKRGEVLRIDPDNGQVLWREDIPPRFVSITLGRQELATVCYDYRQNRCTVTLRSSDKGEVRWYAHFKGRNPGDVLLGEGSLIAYAKNPSLFQVYQLNSGNLLRNFPLIEKRGDIWYYAPLLPGNNYLCLARDKRWVECYELPAIKQLWRYDASSLLIGQNSSGDGKPLITGNESYVALVRGNGRMDALDMVTGELKWSRQFSDNIYRIIPTWEYLYFLEKKLGGIYLCALDANDGTTKWMAMLERTPVSAELILTRQYIVASLNRYARGYHSSLLVFDKFTGEKLKAYQVHPGMHGQTYTEAAVCGENLWLVKDNIIWVLGK